MKLAFPKLASPKLAGARRASGGSAGDRAASLAARLRRLLRRGPAALLLLALPACGALTRCVPAPMDQAAFDALHAAPLAPPEGPLRVFHLGHSLVGRDMPAMLAQLAGAGHGHESQLGWGTSLREHWEPELTIKGHDVENAHPRFRPAREALDSGDYDAVVLTEMVEIRDAIEYHDSWDYLARWALRAWDARPDARVYFYQTWHNVDDPEGWLVRIDRDAARYWEGEIMRRAQAVEGVDRPIRAIPAGEALARFVRAVEARGGVDGIAGAQDLFADRIHLNDLGAYLVALTHYAALYHRSPVGLPRALRRADGTPAAAPGPEAARLMQEAAWAAVAGHPRTGVAAPD